MQKQIFLIGLTLMFINTSGTCQTTDQGAFNRKFYIGGSLFMLGNLDSKNRPDFVQLNFGYRITPKDVVSVELITGKYAWPLGIPFGKSFEDEEERYPGYIRDLGIALAYQRFIWNNVYVAVHAFNSKQSYRDDNNKKIQNGYQLYMTYRAGYHIKLLKNRFFLEPSVAITHWPITTNVPESFAVLERKWDKCFLFPGLHFGYKF